MKRNPDKEFVCLGSAVDAEDDADDASDDDDADDARLHEGADDDVCRVVTPGFFCPDDPDAYAARCCLLLGSSVLMVMMFIVVIVDDDDDDDDDDTDGPR